MPFFGRAFLERRVFMSTYDGAYSDGRMKTIYSEAKGEKPEMTEQERKKYEERCQAIKDFDFAGMFSK